MKKPILLLMLAAAVLLLSTVGSWLQQTHAVGVALHGAVSLWEFHIPNGSFSPGPAGAHALSSAEEDAYDPRAAIAG